MLMPCEDCELCDTLVDMSEQDVSTRVEAERVLWQMTILRATCSICNPRVEPLYVPAGNPKVYCPSMS